MSPMLSRRELLIGTAASFGLVALGRAASAQGTPPFAQRGYYILPCRAPTLGFDACRDMIDAMAEDRANTVVLWMAGGFRSRKFPITWRYNAEHENVRHDFIGKLIDYAHTRGIRCLLGFTPFGYDGTNQYPYEHPELKAIGEDGKPVAEFGIHSWGWNLCPAQAESQRFMLEYAREMAFEFYPQADGLFIESSDYAICHCPQCGPKFFDHEFAFVRRISDEMWSRKPDAQIVVYPHYFSGAKLRFSFTDAKATRQPFDPRWFLFFTPHSAAIEPDLIRRARGSWWWNEAPSRCDIPKIRAGVQQAVAAHCTGFIPSLECYTYVEDHEEFGEPGLKGQRQVPFGFGWVPTRQSPYHELPLRAARIAYREYMANPELSDEGLHAALGAELFGPQWQPAQVEDTLALCEIFATDRDWTVPAPLTNPALVAARRDTGRLDAAKRAHLRQQLARADAIAKRYRHADGAGNRALATIAGWLVDQWHGHAPLLAEG